MKHVFLKYVAGIKPDPKNLAWSRKHLLTRAQVERSLTFQNLSELKNPSISFIETEGGSLVKYIRKGTETK